MDGLIEIKIEYGGLNFADLYTRQGLMPDKKVPFVLGMEGAGVITAIGNNSTNLKVSIPIKKLYISVIKYFRLSRTKLTIQSQVRNRKRIDKILIRH